MRCATRCSIRSSGSRPKRRRQTATPKQARRAAVSQRPGASSRALFDELGFLRHRRRRTFAEGEIELVAGPADMDDAALGEPPEQQFLGKRFLDVLLDDAA